MSVLAMASIKNLQRKGPPPLSFALGTSLPWGSVAPVIKYEKQDASPPNLRATL